MIFGIFVVKSWEFCFFLVRAKRPCYNQSINIYTEEIRFSVRRLDLTEGGTQVRTIETARRLSISSLGPKTALGKGAIRRPARLSGGFVGLCFRPMFSTTRRAPTPPIAASPERLSARGLVPPNIVFRHMVSRTSQNVFCILTTTESVFNSACSVGKFYVVESGIDERRRLCAVRVRDQAAPNNPQENVM